MSIQEICKKYNITNYTINPDGSIDVDNIVDLYNISLTKFPLKFNRVSLEFYSDNIGLETLEGAPESTGGDFYCCGNNLTNLEGSPKHIGGGFYCTDNKLTSLKGCPESVDGDFYCDFNNLTSLEYYPENLSGHFNCVGNPIGSISDKMDIDFIRAFNSLRVLKGNTINIKRLKYVMEMFNKPIDLEEIKKYYRLV